MGDESGRLNAVAEWYSAQSGFEGRMVRASADRLVAHCQGRLGLEVGCGEGYVTQRLADHFERLVVVEAATAYADKVRSLELAHVEVVVSLVEDYETDERFDSIVLSHVLEHVAEPRTMLEACRDLLLPDGRVIIAVPNAGSLHRRLGVELGYLPTNDSLSESDHNIGHRRVYSEATLRAEIEGAGLAIKLFRGHFCKLLSNAQLDAMSPEVQEAMLAIGDEMPAAFTSELFAVCGAS